MPKKLFFSVKIKIFMCDPFKDIFLVFFNRDDIPVRISLCNVINSISSTSICVHLLYWQAWLGMKNCLDSYNTYTTPKQSYITIYYQQSLHFLFCLKRHIISFKLIDLYIHFMTWNMKKINLYNKNTKDVTAKLALKISVITKIHCKYFIYLHPTIFEWDIRLFQDAWGLTLQYQ